MKGQSFTVTRSPIFQPMKIFADFVFCRLCQAGNQQFLFVSSVVLVPTWLSAVCTSHLL